MKQTAINVEKMNRKLIELRRNKEIIVTSSRDQIEIDSEFLPGGIMNIIQNNIIAFYNKIKTKIDKLGKLIVITFSNNQKSVMITMIYRILVLDNSRIYKSLIQQSKL